MVRSPSSNWKKTLMTFLKNVYEPTLVEDHKWLIIGSLASNLQGLEFHPNDIDIIVKKAESVRFLCSQLEQYYAIENKAKNIFADDTLWISTKEKPFDMCTDQWGFQWVFSRLLIEGMFVEIAYIEPPKGYLETIDGIWEAGPQSWNYVLEIPFNDFKVPVVPLEIQLETNFSRGFEDRVKKIAYFLKKRGYNHILLEKALSKPHRIKFEEMLAQRMT